MSRHRKRKRETMSKPLTLAFGEPDWSQSCSTCGQKPVVAGLGLCGPCVFGEADTVDGNW